MRLFIVQLAHKIKIIELIEGNWLQLGADIDGQAASDEAGLSVSLASVGFWLLAVGYWLLAVSKILLPK